MEKEKEIKSLKNFIANFNVLHLQYSQPQHCLKRLNELEGGKLKTIKEIQEELRSPYLKTSSTKHMEYIYKGNSTLDNQEIIGQGCYTNSEKDNFILVDDKHGIMRPIEVKEIKCVETSSTNTLETPKNKTCDNCAHGTLCIFKLTIEKQIEKLKNDAPWIETIKQFHELIANNCLFMENYKE